MKKIRIPILLIFLFLLGGCTKNAPDSYIGSWESKDKLVSLTVLKDRTVTYRCQYVQRYDFIEGFSDFYPLRIHTCMGTRCLDISVKTSPTSVASINGGKTFLVINSYMDTLFKQ